MNLAIIGATGNVGRKTIEILEKSKININNLFLVASEKSAGKKIKFKNKNISVQNLKDYNFSNAEITFFAAGSQIAEQWIPEASKKTIVIDNSKFFRMESSVPLVVAEVNPDDLKNHKNIISNPNCSTIQLALVLQPLHENFKVKRVVVSTYQAVSGAGKTAMDELFNQTQNIYSNKSIEKNKFTKQIAFNVIPHIGSFLENGNTEEEQKMIDETKKILDQGINLSATCVRAAVFIGHSESINIEFDSPLDEKKATELLKKSEGIAVIDHRKDEGYVTPVESAGEDKVYISRIRNDESIENGLNIWVVADNLRKGAALNAVQIAELVISKYSENLSN